MTDVTDALRESFAPTGRLRAALNHGNRILVSRNAQGGPQGITPELAALLAGRLSLPLDFVHFDRAGDVSAAAEEGVYDICFLAVDPERAQTLEFTAPYVQIEGRYLAGPDCDVADAVALVAQGLPVATVQGSAYTLDLARKPGAEHLAILPDIGATMEALDSGRVAAIAGIGAVMEREAQTRPGSRVLSPPFMSIRQAMAMPAGRSDALRFLTGFVARLTRDGTISAILERNGVSADCAVAP
jgi:polar amino acid transport system substrate-binding protein